MRQARKKNVTLAPIRFRSMAAMLLGVTALIAVPLLVVWKQAYITGTSQRIEKMTDTLSSMNRQIASLQLARDRLTATERIESIARSSRGMEYPASDRIVVVEGKGTRRVGSFGGRMRDRLVQFIAGTANGGGR